MRVTYIGHNALFLVIKTKIWVRVPSPPLILIFMTDQEIYQLYVLQSINVGKLKKVGKTFQRI